MKFWVGVTDWEWFRKLSSIEQIEEVNFWQPSSNLAFRALQPGQLFLFKLHSPRDYIVGGGIFSRWVRSPISYVWRAFGTKNGADTEEEMRRIIEKYRTGQSHLQKDYEIGCILLQEPFFFEESKWIPLPYWKKETVRGRAYDVETKEGREIWDKLNERLQSSESEIKKAYVVREPEPKYGSPQVVMPRLGQGSFRVLVADSYKRHCAITNSPVLHVLEAAHIKPFTDGGPQSVNNGILLRQDFHTLFDRGYVTVNTRYTLEVSKRIKQEFDNGREYYDLHGRQINLPPRKEYYPDPRLLEWHNENIYKG